MARYGRMVIAQILMYFIMAAGGILGSRICHLSGTTSNVHRGCSVGGNYGFLVIPLIMTLFGNQGGNVYIPICSVIDTTLVWTLGFTLFTNGVGPVSYTHLDVYKRQSLHRFIPSLISNC